MMLVVGSKQADNGAKTAKAESQYPPGREDL
jgi:hypothetical protein